MNLKTNGIITQITNLKEKEEIYASAERRSKNRLDVWEDCHKSKLKIDERYNKSKKLSTQTQIRQKRIDLLKLLKEQNEASNRISVS